MWLIFLLYFLMASTFTFAKIAIFYMKPIFFIGIRMLVAGSLLLGYVRYFKPVKWLYARRDVWLLAQIIIFHIYWAYILEFWALQFITSSKVCLLYNLSPFITALLCYLLFSQKLSVQKWVALILGFCGMIPLLQSHVGAENFFAQMGVLSLAEGVLFCAIAASAYGWIIMKQLITQRGYDPMMVNGIGMFWGGMAALATALLLEGRHPFVIVREPADMVGALLVPYLGLAGTAVAMVIGCLAFLIIISNIIGYNLYGFLLRSYSPTFLAFAGFLTPVFASIFGLILLAEPLTVPFFVSLGLTMVSLYLFYRDEIRI